MARWDNLYQAFLIVGGTHDQRVRFMTEAYEHVTSSGIKMHGMTFAAADILPQGTPVQSAIAQAGAMLDRISTVEKFLSADRLNVAIVCDSPTEMEYVNELRHSLTYDPNGRIWTECVTMQPPMNSYGYVISIDDDSKIKGIDGEYLREDRVLKMKGHPELLGALICAIGCDEGGV